MGACVGPAAPAGKAKPNHTGRRIVLTTFGSLGDLHPYIAVALGLQARGHEAVIATTRHYQQRIEARGIGFHAVRPDGPDLDADRDAMRRIMDPYKGSEYVIRELMMSALQESYEDILAAAQGADLLVSHILTYATRLAAEKKGIPWAASFLQPLGFFSAYDPPVLPQLPFLSKFRFLGPAFHRSLFWLAKRSCRSWGEPWRRLRAEIHLPPTLENPLFEGQHSPSLVLAMFSQLFAAKQPDWPPQTVVSGFPFSDPSDEVGMPPELVRFLDAGPPPVVFTLGSSAVLDAGPFFEHSTAAAKLVGRRAVLIVGKDPGNRPASLPDGVVAFDYAPFSGLFPRAAAIVHPGGVGTTALAMRSGRPMLVMPYAHDQFDNAARVTRLGIAHTISRRRHSPTRIAAELRRLLDNPVYSRRALGIGEKLRQENGVRAACDALEELLWAKNTAAQSPTG
ncbi:MAG TPA: glycosyltransferase [Planctomycetales bacterium]|nr:glycosyltransferase [Planctomycetales bacterium]